MCYLAGKTKLGWQLKSKPSRKCSITTTSSLNARWFLPPTERKPFLSNDFLNRANSSTVFASFCQSVYFIVCYSVPLTVSVWLRLSVSVSITFSFCLPLCIRLFLSLSLSVPVYMSVCVDGLSILMSRLLCGYVCLSLFLCLSFAIPVSMSVFVSLCLFLHSSSFSLLSSGGKKSFGFDDLSLGPSLHLHSSGKFVDAAERRLGCHAFNGNRQIRRYSARRGRRPPVRAKHWGPNCSRGVTNYQRFISI